MRTTRLAIAAAGLLALAACHKAAETQPADNTAAAIDNNANALDATAANMSNGEAAAELNGMANNMRSDASDVAAAMNMENSAQ